ncbi:hypothetical protein B0I35DRAFT_479153 [Stachybotrys elegans]|uniref:Protection of telomeres protein 1 n=1 Tax=Stachybotrys elegans TaxID=80388 RepID=A0A8K0ST26_9HYPO|nr:hypothetical protein B0I35DRAFT_479153 [Stachybotrys elegans]
MGPKQDLLQLPPGIVPLRDILERALPIGSLVSVIALVTDFRAPAPPRQAGKDWKCQMRLYDKSLELDDEMSLAFHLFRPEEKDMPDVGPGDVIFIRKAKIQAYQMQDPSLLSHVATEVHVFKANKIPKPPADAASAFIKSSWKPTAQPPKVESKYISALYHAIDKSRIPEPEEFTLMKVQSTNIREKFRQLKDVKEGIYADLVVEIVRDPWDSGDKMTIWVSDYTENPLFYSHTETESPGAPAAHSGDSDPYGYTTGFSNKTMSRSTRSNSSLWKGPVGKRSLQITVWPPHTTAIAELQLGKGSWVSMENVQIKFSNGGQLEGYLREDRGRAGARISIHPIDPENCLEVQLERYKNALRLKKDFERSQKARQKGLADAAQAGRKRRSAAAQEEGNSKIRRNAKRAAKQLAAAEKSVNTSTTADNQTAQESITVKAAAAVQEHVVLNSQVKCENMAKSLSSIAQVTEQVMFDAIIDGHQLKLPLPFTNLSYRAVVRVVDFMPSRLEEFARPQRRKSEYDILEGSEDSETSDDSEMEDEEDATSRGWEWQFHLKLQDASAADDQKAVWVLVDNQAAQCLLSMDACDLENDPQAVEEVRQRLFLLWGELEERKARLNPRRVKSRSTQPPPTAPTTKTRGRLLGRARARLPTCRFPAASGSTA